MPALMTSVACFICGAAYLSKGQLHHQTPINLSLMFLQLLFQVVRGVAKRGADIALLAKLGTRV